VVEGGGGYSPECRHRYDGVPEGGWNGGEVGALDVLLGVEHDRGEDDDGHGQREDEETEFGGARLERVAEDAQPLAVPGKLEDAKHAEDSQCDEGAGHVVVVGDAEADVVRHDGHHVDDAHHRTHELAPGCGKTRVLVLGSYIVRGLRAFISMHAAVQRMTYKI
jgi:hypothetical protein